jgi:hypothetical protein
MQLSGFAAAASRDALGKVHCLLLPQGRIYNEC